MIIFSFHHSFLKIPFKLDISCGEKKWEYQRSIFSSCTGNKIISPSATWCFHYTTVKLQQQRNRLKELVLILGYKHHVVVMTMDHSYNCVLIQMREQSSSHHTTSAAAHSAYIQSHQRRMQSIRALYLVCMPVAKWARTRKLDKVFVSP